MTDSRPIDTLCWIRRDLRLSDHTALAEATRAGSVAVVFVFDTLILDPLQDEDDRRLTFIFDSLAELDARLRNEGSRLIVLHGDPCRLIPMLAEKVDAKRVVAGRDYEPYARERDAAIARLLAESGRELILVRDQVVFEDRELLNQSGDVFRVYTPFMKAWRAAVTADRLAAQTPNLAALAPANDIDRAMAGFTGPQGGDRSSFADPLGRLPASVGEIGFSRADLWLAPGESGAQSRLQNFMGCIDRYAHQRDLPAEPDATSGLSVHFRFGTLSIREAIRLAEQRPGRGSEKWVNELIWREFYQMLLATHPYVVDEPFRPEFAGIDWPGENEHFAAWAEGRTGYPIVDAAMRCLNATGWMHNRLRMVAASFLVKDLLVDYRRGEAFFARRLLDFDLASNNGGWQWTASTGADAQPYFRIFNPVLQSRKFDPQGTFIRQWCPELAELSPEEIHWPHGSLFLDSYPAPIVDHATQKTRVLELLESARGRA